MNIGSVEELFHFIVLFEFFLNTLWLLIVTLSYLTAKKMSKHAEFIEIYEEL